MNASASAPFFLISQEPSPRFLGRAASERNRRVARRAGAVDQPSAGLPALTIPAEAAITPALFPIVRKLSVDSGPWRIVWHADRPPILWQVGDDVSSSREFVLREPVVLDVATAAARRQSAWHLLRSSGKPQDGWLSRHIHRRVSRLFSYVFMELGLSANIATFLTFLVGVLAATMMAQTSHATMIAGGLLFWLTSIADGVDGEIARVTLSESAFGEQLDTAVDQLTHLSGLVGVLIGCWRQGIGPAGIAMTVVVVAGTPLVLLWAMAMVRRARGTHQFFVPTKPIETAVFNAARETGALPLRAAAAVFVLFRREAFSFSFFVLSLVTAQRAAIPAVIAVGLIVVIVTLAGYSRALNQALRVNLATAR
jgi:phosphatidylglycerophosphate synthase